VHKIETTFAGRPLTVESGKLARQAAGSVMVRFGDTMVVAAVTAPARSWTARILGARPLRFLGKYSYALYLFHYPVIIYLSKRGLAAWRLASPGESTIPAQLLVMAVAFAVTLALSLASWHLLEQPFLRLKRLFPYRPA